MPRFTLPTFHLAPDGDDRHSGLEPRPTRRGRQGPWRSPQGARDALRRLRADGLAGPVVVLVQDGRYPLAAPLDLGPQDGEVHWRAAPGATPCWDGGEPLAGWVEREIDGRRVWSVHLPDVAAGRRVFRSLFVNGSRRPRARWPKFAVSPEGGTATLRLGAVHQTEADPHSAGDYRFQPRPGDVPDWPSLPDAEFVFLHYWAESRLPQPHRDPATGWFACGRRSTMKLYEAWGPELARYYIDNVAEALTEPGEWYLDRPTGELRYLPRPDETLADTMLVAPRLDTFVRVHGHAYNENKHALDSHACDPVQDIVFEGITWAHGDWFQPPPRFMRHDQVREDHVPAAGSAQGASNVPGVVAFRYARGCAVRRCTFRQLGFYGLEFGPGCRDCDATGNTFEDLGAGGIRIDGSDLDGAPDGRTGRLRITDNEISAYGRVFHQGIGVLVMSAYAVEVVHNHIHDSAYSGISVGWSWGYRPTISRDHLIAWNHIHHLGHGILSDMGAVYLLGVQPGTVVHANHIHHVRAHAYGGWGLYLDEGTSHIVASHNLVHDTQGACLNIHYGRENVIRQNVLVRGGETLVCLGKVEGHIAATLLGNVLVGPSRQLYIGGYEGDIATAGLLADLNLIWFPGTDVAPSGNPPYRAPAVPTHLTFAQWQASGRDRHSVVADPRFRESADGRWTVPRTSPLPGLGIDLIDWSRCGPRRD